MSHLGDRLSALVDGELDGAERDRAHAHLASCEQCRTEAAELRMLKQSINFAQDAMGYRLAAHAAHSNYMIRELAIPETERAKMGEARQMTRVGAALAKANGDKPKVVRKTPTPS